MYKLCSSLACFWLLVSLPAQTIQSRVLDFNTREPIPFVNIGILGKNHGTVSDDAGKFSLEVPKAGWSSSDTLRFSAIGLEWVKTLNKGNISKDLQFCIGLGQAGGIFTKTTSQAPWKEQSQQKFGFKAHLGFYVEGAQE